MLILAIDTALAAAAACVYDAAADRVVAEERILLERGHAEAIVPLLQRVASQIPGGFASIARVAVTTGPGSFTGIRVGIAAAKAIGIAQDVDVVGISTLSALAAPLLAGDGPNVGCVIDARHGNVYFECFGPRGAVVHEAAVLPVRQAASRLSDAPTLLTGPGATLVAIEAWSQGRKAEIAGESVSPSVEFVARLGAVAEAEESPARPFYLKAADVTPSGSILAQANL